MKVKCPRCRRQTEYSPENPFRPFCSERCQTIDLGAWADEQYRVPVEAADHQPGEGPSPGDHEGFETPAKHQLN